MDHKEYTKEVLEWVICFGIAVIIALIVRYYVGTPTMVKNVSMEPTLYANQRLWLNRLGRTFNKEYKRGDIVTFEAPSQLLIRQDELDLDNPVAKYDYQFSGLFSKFVYYVLESNKTSYIKRVIGLPGDHVEIKEGNVYINGEELEEDYLVDGIVTDMGKGGLFSDIIVPEGTYYLLGDNRGHSTDCRFFGCIPSEKIESKVAFRFWPINKMGKIK